jgi:anti-anti-sigma regulatory factor
MAEGQSTVVALPAVVDLDALDGVRDRLLEAIEAGPVTLSCGAVERVATNALLMLVAAAETARRNRFDFAVTELSAPMQAAIERLGLGPHLAGVMKG